MQVDRRPPLRSEALRDAHRVLLQLIDTMSTQLDRAKLELDASEARASLSMLAGKLTIHLAMEDKALYPRLASHASDDMRKLGKRFADEMGGIVDVFKDYLGHWPTPEAVQLDAQRFIVETRQLFDALRARIAKEERDLFPKLDES